MMVNTNKCATMRICSSNSDDFAPVSAYGAAISHVQSMKLLGVTIQSNLKWDTHIESMVTKANSRKYFILVLKRAGAQLADLLKSYCTFLRPVLEYAAPAWHPGITCHQSDLLERVQRQVLRTILPDSSYREALLVTGLQTLNERRDHLCLKFATDLLNSEFSGWLPPRRSDCHQRNLRSKNKLSVLTTRTKRFSMSPIAHLTRLLNSASEK